MKDENSRNDMEQADKKIDVGKYIEKLDNQGNIPDYLVKGLKPEDNYNRFMNKSEIDNRFKSHIISHITSEKIHMAGSSYIESEDLLLLEAKFMQESDDGYGRAFAVINNFGVVVECPFCQETHIHGLEPEIVFGGVVEYESPCSVDFAPESYLIVLRGRGTMPIYGLIQWARDEIKVDGVPLAQALLPDNISREEMESVHLFGWDSISEPLSYKTE